MMTETAPLPDSPKTTKVRAEGARLVLFLGLAALVGAAIATAITLPASLTRAAQIEEMSQQLTAAQNDVESARDAREIAETNAENTKKGMAEREAAVKAREEAVTARESAVSTIEQRVAATTLKDGYTYTAGSTMEAGTYEASSTNSSCYWAIYTSGTNYSDIVDNGFATGVVQITVQGGQDFTSKRCGDWKKVG